MPKRDAVRLKSGTEGFKGANVMYPKSWGCWLTTEDKHESNDEAENRLHVQKAAMALTMR